MTETGTLRSALWDAANNLRGTALDRTELKGYIFPLLFFSRNNEFWDEETTEVAETFGDIDPAIDLEVHCLKVPQRCHWHDIWETSTNAGALIWNETLCDPASASIHSTSGRLQFNKQKSAQ